MHDFELAETQRRPPRLTRWRPRRWQPEYERMVIMSVGGMSNAEIGNALGYSKQHVSNVLNLEQAEVLRQELIGRMREVAMNDIPARLHEITVKTVDRLHRMVHNDDLFEKSPFAVIDRGLEVVKGLGHLKHGNSDQVPGSLVHVGGNAIITLPDALGQRIAEGLEQTMRARELNPPGSQQPKKLEDGKAVRGTGSN